MGITCQNIITGGQVRMNKDGYWARRGWFVEGVDPSNRYPLLLGGTYDEIDATRTVIGQVKLPAWGDPDPYLIGTPCIDVTQDPYPKDSRTSYIVQADYGPQDLVNSWKITASSSGQYREASVDKDGKPLFVILYPNPAYNGSSGSGSGSSSNGSSGANLIDYGVAQYLAPGSIVTFERDFYSTQWPIRAAIQSRTNSQPFLGQPAGMVLCHDLAIETLFSGLRQHGRFIFEISADPNGWQQTFLFRDPYTGRVPSDVSGTDGKHGILLADPYKKIVGQYDFTTLGLPTNLLTG